MHLMLNHNRYTIIFDSQEEAENAVEILSDLIHNKTYEDKANRVFHRTIPRRKIDVENPIADCAAKIESKGNEKCGN